MLVEVYSKTIIFPMSVELELDGYCEGISFRLLSGLISATINHCSCHSFQDVAKALIKHGADVNRQLSAGKDKVTPLMLACQNGNLDIARLLVQHKAQVEQKGK